MGRQAGTIRADLHVHTCYSPDAVMTPQELIAICTRNEINCLAVTDHNTIQGALEVARQAPFFVIVGEEIKTSHGEIIGLFLEEEIPRDLSAEETIARIRSQGGLVLVPHPYDYIRRSTLRPESLEWVASQADILEVLNARLLLQRHVSRARSLAARLGLLVSAGSDAHTPVEIGQVYVEMPECHDKVSFQKSLAEGVIHGTLSSPLVHLATTWSRWKRRSGPH